VGGTGKTPLVIWLARALREAGHHPGVVLRGYGGTSRAPRLVVAEDTSAEVGDEAVLVRRRSGGPVAVGANRVAAARLLVAQRCTVIIADDGLQHLALRRDLAIAVVDGARGFGNGALLPAGPLREPAARLDDADLVVVQGRDLQGVASRHDPLVMELEPEVLFQLAGGLEESPATLRGEAVHAVAGIGNPQRFFRMLRGLGANLVEHPFPDHHAFRPAELAFGDALRIVMTEKDAVRCRAFAHERMWCLSVAARLPDADARRLLQAVLEKAPGGSDSRA
jgi:tetraacyldisaccharide 4'-kinase